MQWRYRGAEVKDGEGSAAETGCGCDNSNVKSGTAMAQTTFIPS